MSNQTLLTSLLRHKAWADAGLTAVLAGQGAALPAPRLRTALDILGHAHAVDRIFVANLQGLPHGRDSTDADPGLVPGALFGAIEATDRWLIEHAASLDAAALAAPLDFRFSDGRPGRMSREEMLAHLIAHGGYHRGEIGRILSEQLGDSPPDTFTGYLHRVEGRGGMAPA